MKKRDIRVLFSGWKQKISSYIVSLRSKNQSKKRSVSVCLIKLCLADILRTSQLQQRSYYMEDIKFFCLIQRAGRDHDRSSSLPSDQDQIHPCHS